MFRMYYRALRTILRNSSCIVCNFLFLFGMQLPILGIHFSIFQHNFSDAKKNRKNIPGLIMKRLLSMPPIRNVTTRVSLSRRFDEASFNALCNTWLILSGLPSPSNLAIKLHVTIETFGRKNIISAINTIIFQLKICSSILNFNTLLFSGSSWYFARGYRRYFKVSPNHKTNIEIFLSVRSCSCAHCLLELLKHLIFLL